MSGSNAERHSSLSMLSSFVSEESDSLLFTSTHFYVGMFEFCQGSFPQTIWEDGIAVVSDYEAFKSYIVNAQVASSNKFSAHPQPTVVVSTYETLSYIGVYFQIFDVEARGFTRSIVFVLANINPEIVSHVNYLYIDKILNFVEQIQAPALETFPKELTKYAASLQLCIEKNESKRHLLQSKWDELAKILPHFNITDISTDGAIEQSPDFYILIHNDLRPFKELTNFDKLVKLLDKFVAGLPTSLLCSSLATHANVYESDPAFGFAGVNKEYGFSTLAFSMFAKNYEDDRYSIRSFFANNVFHYCAFTILSGKTLVIQSEDTDVASALATKFGILVPFNTSREIRVLERATAADCLRYQIVVVQHLADDIGGSISLLDLDSNRYSGAGCPPQSLVFTRLAKVVSLSERAFLLALYSELKKIASEFILRLAMVVDKAPDTPDLLFDCLRGCGLSRDDEPIFRYWIACFFNHHALKPILKTAKDPVERVYDVRFE